MELIAPLQRNRIRFLQWLASCALAGVIGFVGAFPAGQLATQFVSTALISNMSFQVVMPLSNLLGWTLAGLLMGLSFGVLQGIILAKNGVPAGRWCLATTVGWALGWVFLAIWLPPSFGAALGPIVTSGAMALLVVGAISGITIGLCQGIITRWSPRRTRLWTIFSGLGLGLGWLMGGLVFQELATVIFWPRWIPWIAGRYAIVGGLLGISYALLTGWQAIRPQPRLPRDANVSQPVAG